MMCQNRTTQSQHKFTETFVDILVTIMINSFTISILLVYAMFYINLTVQGFKVISFY